MAPYPSDRIANVRKSLTDNQIDTFLVLTEANRRYLSGFTGEDTMFNESAGALLITQDALILATDSRYTLQAESEAPLYEIVCYTKGLAKELPHLLKRLGTCRLGFEARRTSVDQHQSILKEIAAADLSIELIATSNLVENLRIVKDDEEIDAIRKSIALAETAFTRFAAGLAPGMTETEAAWELERQMRSLGAQSVSFPVICACGPDSALPHAVPGDRTLDGGSPLMFDWGAKLNGYCSDMTRTMMLGRSDEQFQKIFAIVYDAQQKAISAIRPGVHSKSIDDIARNHIAEKGYRDFFGHGLGHGVGIDVHELPALSPVEERDTVLEKNMVFTVEPGIYLPGWGGIRLENMVRVTSDGVEILNRLETNIRIADLK